jgi:hypothetical protein
MFLISPVVGTALFASGAATAVTARKARGTFAVECPTTLVAPLDAPLTPQRGVPTKNSDSVSLQKSRV